MLNIILPIIYWPGFLLTMDVYFCFTGNEILFAVSMSTGTTQILCSLVSFISQNTLNERNNRLKPDLNPHSIIH